MKRLLVGFALMSLLASSLALASMMMEHEEVNTVFTDAPEGGTARNSYDDSVIPTVVVAVERSNKTKGATTIEWDSAFEDLDYTLGDVLTITVHWDVLSGYAEYDSFELRGKGFTPVPRKDPATGELVTIVQNGNSVSFDIRFDELHWDETRQVDIGNAHLKLYLFVDEDGDGSAELLAGFGVNIHVEDPA